jgi:putative ABC transport system substrate-binding protein
MRRREFLGAFGSAAAWPVVVRAQPALGKAPIVGFLGGAVSAWGPWASAFSTQLRELGWIDGRTIAVEYRWDEGRRERVTEIVAEFMRLKTDVIVAGGTAAPTVKQATSDIPIIFVLATDPVGSGLVTSLARPGANVTGLSNQSADLAGKRLELLREIVPRLRRVAILANDGPNQATLEMERAEKAAGMLGLDVALLKIRRAEDIAALFETLKADALYVVPDNLVSASRTRINTLALAARLPTIFSTREYVQAGGLMSYGSNLSQMFRRAAEYVDKVLRGTKPSDIPVEQPTKLELTINLVTAKAIGLTIPEAFLLRADEVIE